MNSPLGGESSHYSAITSSTSPFAAASSRWYAWSLDETRRQAPHETDSLTVERNIGRHNNRAAISRQFSSLIGETP